MSYAGTEQPCSSRVSPLPFCRRSFSRSRRRAVLGHGLLREPFYSPDVCKAAEGGKRGVDWRVPAFRQPARALRVGLSCVPRKRRRSEEDNGVVTCRSALSSTSKQPKLLQTEQWLIASKQSFFSFLLQKFQALKGRCSLPHPCLPLLCGWEDGCAKGGRFPFQKGRIRSGASCWLSRTDGKHTALPSSAG